MRILWLAALSAGCVTTGGDRPPRLEPKVEVQTFDPSGRPTDGRGLAMHVWGPGDGSTIPPVGLAGEPLSPQGGAQGGAKQGGEQGGAAKPEAGAPTPAEGEGQGQGQAPSQDEITRRRTRDAELRNQFGSAVIVAPDGTVSKQYFLSGESTTVFQNLLREPDAAPNPDPSFVGFDLDPKSQSVLARMLGAHQVKITLFRDFEPIETIDIRAEVKGAVPTIIAGPKNSLLLVSAQPTALQAFEDALNLFFSSVPQIELEVKVIEFTTSDAVAFGVRPIDADTATLNNLGSDRLIRDITSSFPMRPPSLGVGSTADKGLLTIGGVHDGWELAARIEALEINQLADVLSQPKLTVRNGGVASVSTLTKVPYPKAKFTSSGSNTVADIAFESVGISMHIRPVIAGTDTVILQIYAKVSAVTGFSPTDPVPTPTISEREVVTQVHVRHDQATTISGLLSKSTFDNVSKIPLLGDIPILGYLFRSTTKQETTQNVEFIIIPRIRMGLERGDDLDVLNPIGR